MQFLSSGFMACSAPNMELDKTCVADEAGHHSIPIKIYIYISVYSSPNNFVVAESYSHIYHVSVLPNGEVSSLYLACSTQIWLMWLWCVISESVVELPCLSCSGRSSKVASRKSGIVSVVLNWGKIIRLNLPTGSLKSKINPFITSNNSLLINLSAPARAQTLYKHMYILN